MKEVFEKFELLQSKLSTGTYNNFVLSTYTVVCVTLSLLITFLAISSDPLNSFFSSFISYFCIIYLYLLLDTLKSDKKVFRTEFFDPIFLIGFISILIFFISLFFFSTVFKSLFEMLSPYFNYILYPLAMLLAYRVYDYLKSNQSYSTLKLSTLKKERKKLLKKIKSELQNLDNIDYYIAICENYGYTNSLKFIKEYSEELLKKYNYTNLNDYKIKNRKERNTDIAVIENF